jgi:hypothetical protein
MIQMPSKMRRVMMGVTVRVIVSQQSAKRMMQSRVRRRRVWSWGLMVLRYHAREE